MIQALDGQGVGSSNRDCAVAMRTRLQPPDGWEQLADLWLRDHAG